MKTLCVKLKVLSHLYNVYNCISFLFMHLNITKNLANNKLFDLPGYIIVFSFSDLK